MLGRFQRIGYDPQNEISSNDSDVTPGNLKMAYSSNFSLHTRQHSKGKMKLKKNSFFLRW